MPHVKNAVILAAGKSYSFAPFSSEIPKDLFCVKGETLIERLIRQLKEAGVQNIAVVVGHMREKLFFLAEKHGVTLVNNPLWSSKNNVYSLYLAREFLDDCFVCSCDNYFPQNVFLTHEDSTRAYHQATESISLEKEFVAEIDEGGRVRRIFANRQADHVLVGFAYSNDEFRRAFVAEYERAREGLGADRFFWQEFVGQNLDAIELYAKIFGRQEILEFDSVNEVSRFDPELINNLDSKIVSNICATLGCKRGEIKGIKAIAKGLTNVSFIFEVSGGRYVYRHPGGSSSSLVNRPAEHFAQNLAARLGIDGTLVYIHPHEGWKITRYVEGTYDFPQGDRENLEHFMQMVRKLHLSGADCGWQFDVIDQADKLLSLAANVNASLKEQFAALRAKIVRLHHYTEADCVPKCLCHNDVYFPNFLISGSELHLIDWEYAGMEDPANDFGSIVCRDSFDTEEAMLDLLELYFGRPATDFEKRHYMSYAAISGWYWFCWSLFKDSVSEDNGYYMFNAYRKASKLVDRMLSMYETRLFCYGSGGGA